MIEINNLTAASIEEDFIKQIIQGVFKGEKKELNVSLFLLGPARMRKLNKKYRGKKRVTNVLTFQGGEFFFEKASKEIQRTKNWGEIVICPREVKKSAKRFKTSFQKELARVLIHGILHLFGYDHEKSEDEERKMREKEEHYLEETMKLGT